MLCRAGRDYWEFYQGSALVRIFVVDDNYLYATFPLNKLPKDTLEELLIYINSNKVIPYKLGVYKNKIYISYRTHLSDIYSELKGEVKKNIIDLALKADELDDFFNKKFGCEMSLESKAEETNIVEQVQQAAVEKEETTPVENTDIQKPTSMVARLKKLKNLFEMELINEAEYTATKKRILEEI